MPQSMSKISGASCPAFYGQGFKTKTFGAGVVRARPPHNYAWRWQNLVRANFAASKNKKEKGVRGE